ncbi:MAG: galactonate dehydratase [Candidatus Latescibacter sp.]|nr:galactonate dehydratase [Candidatus Latescibacter sp.]
MQISAINTWFSKEAHRNLIFIEVVTDEGLTGIGEAYSVGPDEAVAATVKHFESWLIGKDPRESERLWQMMYNFSRFPGGLILMSALSGIDIALWDIKGKAAGLPVWALLGGKCRDRIRTYGHASGNSPKEIAEHGKKIVEKYGYTAVKCFPLFCGESIPPWNSMVREGEKRMRAIREILGPDIDIAVDFHAAIPTLYQAIEAANVLEPYRPMFLEEPTRPENMDALAQVARSTSIPVATGEMLYTKWEFRELLNREAASIIQPDICIAGGITEMKKIAAVAESYYVPLAPHNPMGPVATAASVHLSAAIPNFLILEYLPDDSAERLDVVDRPVEFKDGWLEIPDRPGLGIELNKDGLAKHPPKEWHRPFRYNQDGLPGII